MAKYIDIADESEDDRIRFIGEAVMVTKKDTAFLVENEAGKADRYIAKLKLRFPGIRVIARGPGPVEGVVWVKMGAPVN